jgi:molybdate transport system ATP-binding protein
MIQVRIRKTVPGEAGAPGFELEAAFEAGRGITAVFGPPGAGKTLLLDILAGLLRADGGRILADGEILYDHTSGVHVPPGRRPCGYVLSKPALLPHLNLRENLLLACRCRGMPKLESHRLVEEWLGRLGLAGAAGRKPGSLSSQERLRGAFARACVGSPKLLLVDEPEAEEDRAETLALMLKMQREGVAAVLYATRRLEDGLELGGDVIVLSGGRVLQTGPCREVVETPASVEAARLIGGFNLLPATIVSLDPERNTSRLKLDGFELTGPYFGGRLRGDRVTVCVRWGDLRARPASGKPGANQVTAALVHVAGSRRTARLHLEGGLVVEMPLEQYQEWGFARHWTVEFAAERLRVV